MSYTRAGRKGAEQRHYPKPGMVYKKIANPKPDLHDTKGWIVECTEIGDKKQKELDFNTFQSKIYSQLPTYISNLANEVSNVSEHDMLADQLHRGARLHIGIGIYTLKSTGGDQ